LKLQKKSLLLLTTLFLVLAVTSVTLLSQNPNIRSDPSQTVKNATLIWEKTYGGKGDDRAFHAVKAEDGYLVVGSSTSFTPGETTAWVLRVDSDGNELWNRAFSRNAGSEFRQALTLEDGFLLVGNTFLTSGNTNGYVVKIDKQGNPIWNLTAKKENGLNKLFSACPTQDNFLLAGLAKAPDSENSDVWLIKISAQGNLIWNKTFGGATDDAGRAVTPTQDSGCIIAGYTDSTGNGNYDFLTIKTDTSGNLLWNHTYGGTQSDKAYAIAPAADGYVIAGDTRSKGAGETDAWTVKIDFGGNLLWEKAFGGNGFDAPTCIAQASQGEFLVGGTTFSFGNGQRDFWLFTVEETGSVGWSCTVGRSGYEEAYAVLPVGTGELVMAGWTNSLGEGSYDFYFVKLGETGS